MLTLKNQRLQQTEPVPPKYITISLGHNIFGRGYKSDIKLLGYSWISRKHLSVSNDCIHRIASGGYYLLRMGMLSPPQ